MISRMDPNNFKVSLPTSAGFSSNILKPQGEEVLRKLCLDRAREIPSLTEKGVVEFRQSSPVRYFIQDLSQKINKQKYPEQQSSLQAILSSKESYCFDLPWSKPSQFIQSLQNRLIKVIATLDPNEIHYLKAEVDIPNKVSNIFELSLLEQRFVRERCIPDEALREYHFKNISLAFLQAGEPKRALEIVYLITTQCLQESALRDLSQSFAQSGAMHRALEMAKLISNQNNQGIAFKSLAQGLAQSGDANRAIEIGQLILDPSIQTSALQTISQVLMQKNQIEDAIKSAFLIPDAKRKSQALHAIVPVLVTSRQNDKAIEVACSIPDMIIKGEALLHVFNHIMKVNLGKAKKVSLLIPDESARGYALSRLSHAFIKLDDVDQSLVIANLIPTEHIRDETLLEIYQILMNHEKINKALEVALLIFDKTIKDHIFPNLSQKFVDIGDFDSALKVAYSILDPRIQDFTIQNVFKPVLPSRDLDEIASLEKCTKESDLQKTSMTSCIRAKNLMLMQCQEKAINLANSIPKPHTRGCALQKIAQILVSFQEFKKAVEIANLIPIPEIKEIAFQQISLSIQVGIPFLSVRYKLDEALALVDLIPLESIKNRALCDLSEVLVSNHMFEKALSIANLITNQDIKMETIQDVSLKIKSHALFFAEKGEIEKAIAFANQIPNEDMKALALVEIQKM